MSDMCDDNRFDLIEKYKKKLIEATNIETASDEMTVLDDILFRFWQMGWLDSIDRMLLVKESAKTLMHSVGDSVSAKAFRNAGRFIQNAIDGETPEFEKIPSAQPGCDEWCTDCKEYDQQKHSCPRWNRVIRQTVEDLKKQKTGHWVHKLRHSEDKQFDYYEETCSVCGAEARFWWRNFNYCPMCGAKMEGIKDETD